MSLLKKLVFFPFSGLLLVACQTNPPIEFEGITELNQGIPIIAENLLNPISQWSLHEKSVVLQPFRDASTGDQTPASDDIEQLFMKFTSQGKFSDFRLLGVKSTVPLGEAKYIIRGVISYEQYPKNLSKHYYHIYAILADIATGAPVAHDDVWVYTIRDTTQELVIPPIADPTVAKDVEAVKQGKTIEIADPEFDRKLSKAKRASREKRYSDAITTLNELIKSDQGQTLEIYTGLYFANIETNNLQNAEKSFYKMLEVGFKKNNKLPLYFLFKSGQTEFRQEYNQQYKIWMNQLSAYLSEYSNDCLKIIGHSSKQGDEVFNKTLSLKRANAIQSKIASLSPVLSTKLTTDGMGEENTIIGTEPDDDKNKVDRRVEFELVKCSNE